MRCLIAFLNPTAYLGVLRLIAINVIEKEISVYLFSFKLFSAIFTIIYSQRTRNTFGRLGKSFWSRQITLRVFIFIFLVKAKPAIESKVFGDIFVQFVAMFFFEVHGRSHHFPSENDGYLYLKYLTKQESTK